VTTAGGTDSLTVSGGGLIDGAIDLGAAADSLILSGGRITGTTELGTGANTVTVNGAFTTESALQASGGGTIGMTVQNGGSLTLNHALNTGATALAVNSGGTLTANADITNGGALTNNGTLFIAAGKTVTAATWDNTSAGRTVFELNKANGVLSAGTLNLTAGGGNLANSMLEVRIKAGSQTLRDGGTVSLLTGTAPGTAPALSIIDNSYLFNFTLAPVGNTLALTVDSVSLNDVATDEDNEDVAETLLEDLADSTDPVIVEIETRLNNAPTREAFNTIIEATEPTIDGSNVRASLATSDSTLGLTGDRMGSLRTGGEETGMATGNLAKGLSFWAQLFGQTSDQDPRGGVSGYDSRTWGGAAGIDTRNLSDDALVGLAVSYGATSVDSDNINTTETEVDTYQLTLYGEYDLGRGRYIDGTLAYARNTIERVRHNVGLTGENAQGDYQSWQAMANVEAGRDYTAGQTILTPYVLARAVYYDPDSYTETGAGGASLHIEGSSMSIFELGAGLKAGWELKQGNGAIFKPQLRAGYRYDLIGDRIQDTATFTGGGGAISVEGPDPAQGSFNLGTTLRLDMPENWNVMASYDFDARQDYKAHAGFVRVSYKF
jgi:outer membrane autotransporter protein